MIGKIKIAIFLSFLLLTSQAAFAQSSGQAQADEAIVQARELLKQGYFDSAVVKYQEAFKIAPRYKVPYEELGKLMLEKRNFAYAIQMYTKLVDLEPNNAGYHRTLFDLNAGFDAPEEAVKSGEVLVRLNEADNDLLKKMAGLYKEIGESVKQAQTMERYAVATQANGDYWNDIATIYLGQGKHNDALRSIDNALAQDSNSAKFRNTQGRIYMAKNDTSEAEKIFAQLSSESPNDQGLKDELAQIYAIKGDNNLVKGRGHTALKYYDLAEETGKAKDPEELEASLGVYRGTVNTAQQVFNTNDSVPGLGLGSYRRGASGFSSVGGSIAQRRESAELLLRPQFLFDADFGNNDVNSYNLIDNVVRVPIRGTELDLRVRHSYRDVSSFAGSATRNFIYAGANYNWNEDWSTQAYVGSQGLYDVTTLYEGDRARGGILFQRDIWAFTPFALGTDLFFDRQGLFGGVSIGERWSIDGTLDLYQFEDGIDQTIYSIGPSYQLIFEPGVQELQLSYIHSGQFNNQTIDPIQRFTPGNLQIDSVGLDYNRVINDNWRFRAGYFHSWVNDSGGGGNGGTWNIGSDFQLWKGAWLGLNYQRGTFSGGQIAPNLQGVDNDNDNLNVNFGVTF